MVSTAAAPPRNALRVGEVEAQAVRRDQRTLLRHVSAQHVAQRLVQKMGGRMVARELPCGVPCQLGLHRFALARAAGYGLAHMNDKLAQTLFRTRNFKHPCRWPTDPLSPIWPPDSA